MTLGLIKRTHLHSTIPDIDFTLRLLLPRKRMLHPFVIVSLRIVLSGVRAARFFAVGGRFGCLCCAGEEIAEFERLNEVTIPDHAAIFGADVFEHLVNFVDAANDVSNTPSEYALHQFLTPRHLDQASLAS